MAVVKPLLTSALILCSMFAGVLALHLFITFRRLGPAGMPPFPYNDSTLRDFELLSAAGGLLLFTSFIAVVAGFYEYSALIVAVRVPATMFTLFLIALLYRWRGRF